jgi:hypothetical protein
MTGEVGTKTVSLSLIVSSHLGCRFGRANIAVSNLNKITQAELDEMRNGSKLTPVKVKITKCE